jgi:hypothetical protein
VLGKLPYERAQAGEIAERSLAHRIAPILGLEQRLDHRASGVIFLMEPTVERIEHRQ